MSETCSPPMDHCDDDEIPCDNRSPVTFIKKGNMWAPWKYDENKWQKHDIDIGTMFCKECKVFVSKVPVTRV